MLGYVMGPASVQATYMKTENSVVWGTGYSNVVAPSSNVTIENTNGFMVSGLYHVTDDATAKIGYEYTRATAPSNPNLTSIQSYYGINLLKPGTNASGVGATRVFWIGGDYKVTSALDVGVGYYNVDNYNDPEAGKQYRANIGSLLVDYTFNKSFDTYFGLESLNFSGPGLVKQAPVDAYSSTTRQLRLQKAVHGKMGLSDTDPSRASASRAGTRCLSSASIFIRRSTCTLFWWKMMPNSGRPYAMHWLANRIR
jgi:hypothetical protein